MAIGITRKELAAALRATAGKVKDGRAARRILAVVLVGADRCGYAQVPSRQATGGKQLTARVMRQATDGAQLSAAAAAPASHEDRRGCPGDKKLARSGSGGASRSGEGQAAALAGAVRRQGNAAFDLIEPGACCGKLVSTLAFAAAGIFPITL